MQNTNTQSDLSKAHSARKKLKEVQDDQKVQRTRSSFRQKTPSKSTTKSRKPRKTLEQKTAQQLVKPTDEAFSRYIRIRDASWDGTKWVGKCITCPRQCVVIDEFGKWIASSQNGHMISRGVFSLRYDEENCNLQCAHCNVWLDKDEMIERYRTELDKKYGDGTYKKLKALSKLPEAYKRPSKPELLQIIADSKEQVEWYLAHNT